MPRTPDGNLDGRVALVAGGSRGVGQAICLELAERGADVAFLFLSREDLAATTTEGIESFGRRALPLKADITDPAAAAAAVADTIEGLGPIDILAHSAGGSTEWAAVRDLTAEQWAGFVAIDLNGAFNVIQPVVRHMHERGRGAIVAISSIAAQMCQSRNAQGAAAKAGLEALIRVVAREEGRHGIRANVVSIGLTDNTDQARNAYERWGPEASKRVVAAIPLQRPGEPREVARMVAYLVGDEGSYITGKVIQVDGGQIIAG